MEALRALATFCRVSRRAARAFGSRLRGSPAVVAERYQRGTEQQQPGGMVVLASPHLEDATDVNALTPFGNLFRLASRIASTSDLWRRMRRYKVG